MASSVALWILLCLMPIIKYVASFVRFHPSDPEQHIFTTTSECRLIIEGTRFPDGKQNTLSSYEARARKNGNLKWTFGIQNAFTTNDESDAKKFVKEAQRLISVAGVDWDGLARELSRMIEGIIDKNLDGVQARIAVTPKVRALSLRTSLWVISSEMRNGIQIRTEDLANLGKIINSTWIDMKGEAGEQKVLEFKDNADLQARLSAVLPTTSPTFETLWRIVLSLFIVLRGHHNQRYKQILIEFARKPTTAQFRREYDNGISAEFIVKEGLRLYPPTRRIRRIFKFPVAGSIRQQCITAAANVEACHRDMEVWGPGALEFKPARWKEISKTQRENFLAFGCSPFLCPASNGFGTMAIGLLVGVLSDAFGDREEWVLGSDEDKDLAELQSGEKLKNDRGAYEGLFFERSAQATGVVL
ncbi:uncharacterized protein DSM5745_10046 [Aspergillus mulundensis]|uniref:Cytochrome P450 n=1 Tax=Aspergillus mulundensis TaxID=1810919 RepID=A0A3D8QMB2_9EURO|nr:hypothetical protein DSM5745_10046 [Aspergillus mulundensis]RDW62935.1 hypothetical protein DSM5745_10046 [Aspergillus mulundensis]